MVPDRGLEPLSPHYKSGAKPTQLTRLSIYDRFLKRSCLRGEYPFGHAGWRDASLLTLSAK